MMKGVLNVKKDENIWMTKIQTQYLGFIANWMKNGVLSFLTGHVKRTANYHFSIKVK